MKQAPVELLLLGLANKLRFQLHRADPIDAAINVVIAADKTNVSHLSAHFDDLR